VNPRARTIDNRFVLYAKFARFPRLDLALALLFLLGRSDAALQAAEKLDSAAAVHYLKSGFDR
jgi:hypothetical protein